ncbi:hypothetical protein GJAV_G00008740 [Gymnothorax javanicus]|nr:hypothetical protein GJAV_G00008740 [Gymnothorax javanicus]
MGGRIVRRNRPEGMGANGTVAPKMTPQEKCQIDQLQVRRDREKRGLSPWSSFGFKGLAQGPNSTILPNSSLQIKTEAKATLGASSGNSSVTSQEASHN